MKKIFLFLYLLAACYFARSQNLITRCEYWTDNNYSARVVPAITPSAVYTFNSAIDYSSLSTGVHVFNIRFRQTDGKWSNVLNKMFVKPPTGPAFDNKITRYEYWTDNAYASRTAQSVAPTDNYSFLSGIDFSALSVGVHVFNLRFRQSDGKWSSVISQMFVKPPADQGLDNNITGLEYWLDNAYAGKVSQAVTPASAYSFISGINCNSLSVGAHVFNIRFRQTDGKWSSTISQMFYKHPPAATTDNSVTSCEYWMDNGFGSRVQQPVTPGSTYSFISGIDCSGLSTGVHIFNIRFRQTDGKWSSVLNQMFVKPPATTTGPGTIARYEYWFNDGFAGRAVINTPAQRIYTTGDLLAIDTMSRFINVFHSRYRDNYGNWTYIDQQFYSLGLDLKLYLQGFYEPGTGEMRMTQNEWGNNFEGDVVDTVTIEIRESLSPYRLMLVFHSVELHTDGTCRVEDSGIDPLNPPQANNTSYYIAIKHRNSVETWSQAVQLNSNSAYDYTDDETKAYGNNLKPEGDTYLIFSGDVNQDGYVDFLDLIDVYNLNIVSASGYLTSDLTGDGYVDFIDLILVYNNNVNSVGIITP
ncbi:MAG: hypothetical protein AB9834_12875 [Lentimicrobium sp.]